MVTPYDRTVRVGQPPVVLDGVGADEGLALLEERVDRVACLDRSAFLTASFGHPAPWLHHVPVSALLRTDARCTEDPPPPPLVPSARYSGGGRYFAVAFAPEHGAHATDWATAHPHRLLAPDAAVTGRAAPAGHPYPASANSSSTQTATPP